MGLLPVFGVVRVDRIAVPVCREARCWFVCEPFSTWDAVRAVDGFGFLHKERRGSQKTAKKAWLWATWVDTKQNPCDSLWPPAFFVLKIERFHRHGIHRFDAGGRIPSKSPAARGRRFAEMRSLTTMRYRAWRFILAGPGDRRRWVRGCSARPRQDSAARRGASAERPFPFPLDWR